MEKRPARWPIFVEGSFQVIQGFPLFLLLSRLAPTREHLKDGLIGSLPLAEDRFIAR
jgi:hypothetical protein